MNQVLCKKFTMEWSSLVTWVSAIHCSPYWPGEWPSFAGDIHGYWGLISLHLGWSQGKRLNYTWTQTCLPDSKTLLTSQIHGPKHVLLHSQGSWTKLIESHSISQCPSAGASKDYNFPPVCTAVIKSNLNKYHDLNLSLKKHTIFFIS